MRISPAEVEEIARLARLALAASERQRMARELDAILGYFEQLGELDTSGVEATTHVVPLDCRLRDDRCAESLAVSVVRSLAPRCDGDLIEVPRIIEGGEG